MKRFVVNRDGRIVFPCNFLPSLNFSLLNSIDQLETVMKRDFETKAPSESEIIGKLKSSPYQTRGQLLQDILLYLRNINRHTLTMYEKRPTRWADVPQRRDDVFLPSLHTPPVTDNRATIETSYLAASAGSDRLIEDKIFGILFDIYRASESTAMETTPLHRTVAEATAIQGALVCRIDNYDPDYPLYTYDDVVNYTHRAPEIEALMRHAMILHNEFCWHAGQVQSIPIDQLQPDDIVVVLHPKNEGVREFIRKVRNPSKNESAPIPAIETKPPLKPFPPVIVKKQMNIMPRIEALTIRKGERICTNEDLIRNAAYSWSPMSMEDIREKTGIEQRVYTEQSLEEISLEAARTALAKSRRRPEEIGAVLFCSCTSARTMPAVSTWISARLGILQTHASCDVLAACAGLSYGISEAIRLMQESERPVLIVGGEKFSDKIGTVRTSRMLFGDAAAALVIGPAPAGEAPDIEVFQTYASGPLHEVDAIMWPNPEFDNDLTVYGPDVKALVRRYLRQMVDELRALPHPDGQSGSLMDSIDLVVPHQANKTMVTTLAEEAGIAVDRLYFNIERVGNTSAASIPLALHDAIQDGVIDHPMRVFAPGFGAGATAGYVVMRVNPGMV